MNSEIVGMLIGRGSSFGRVPKAACFMMAISELHFKSSYQEAGQADKALFNALTSAYMIDFGPSDYDGSSRRPRFFLKWLSTCFYWHDDRPCLRLAPLRLGAPGRAIGTLGQGVNVRRSDAGASSMKTSSSISWLDSSCLEAPSASASKLAKLSSLPIIGHQASPRELWHFPALCGIFAGVLAIAADGVLETAFAVISNYAGQAAGWLHAAFIFTFIIDALADFAKITPHRRFRRASLRANFRG